MTAAMNFKIGDTVKVIKDIQVMVGIYPSLLKTGEEYPITKSNVDFFNLKRDYFEKVINLISIISSTEI